MCLKRVLITLAILVLSYSVNVSAQLDPSIEWKNLRTPHFDILFNAKHQPLAEEYARQAERAYYLMVPVFTDAPERTVLVINDSTDQTNGSATPIPRSIISTYPALPSSNDILNYYGNWAQELATHEFAHILNFEPTSGVMSPFRFLFGSIIRPNGLLPRWYLEGLAVYTESLYTNHGRLKSAYYGAITRALIEENRLEKEDIGRINDSRIPTFPMGARPYYMGALMWKHLTRAKGIAAAGELNKRYSGRFPFFINGPAVDMFGKNYSELLAETYVEESARAKNDISEISKSPVTRGKRLGSTREVTGRRSPQISPDGRRLIYIENSAQDGTQLVMRDRTDSKNSFLDSPAKLLTSLENIQRATWSADGKQIVLDGLETYKRYYQYSDLYLFDVETLKAARLTVGARASEAAFAPNGKHIAFVGRTPGGTQLMRVRVDNKQIETLYSPALQVRVSSPVFLDANDILFLERNLDGIENFQIYSLKDKKVRPFGWTAPVIRSPHLVQGDLYFSQEQGREKGQEKIRTSNVYRYSLKSKGSVVRLTNTTTYIQDGTWDARRQTLIAARLTADGFTLEESPAIERTVAAGTSVGTSSNANPSSNLQAEWPPVPETSPLSPSSMEVTDYSPSHYLWPQYWIPFFSFVPEGFVAQAMLSAQDPLGRHNFGLDLGYESLTKKPSGAISYTNETTPVAIQVAAADQYSYLYGFKSSTHTTLGTFGGSFFLPGLSNNWIGGLSFRYLATEFPGLDYSSRGGPTLSFGYGNASRKGYQISAEKGGKLSTGYTYYLPNVGSLTYGEGFFDGTFYTNWLLPEHHAMMFRAQSVFSPRNRSILVGASSAGGEYMASLINPKYVVRGYPTGEFIGWSLVNTTFEYRFPIAYSYTGFGTKPFFIRNWSGAVVFDSITLEGKYFDSTNDSLTNTGWGTFYSGVGLELRTDVTIAYHVPAQLKLGLYQGLTKAAYGALMPYFGFSIDSF